MRRHE